MLLKHDSINKKLDYIVVAMNKNKKKRLCIRITSYYDINAEDVEMYNVFTEEIKKYSDIEESDMENWILNDVKQIVSDCDFYEHEEISFEDITE
jgi:methyl coenzyme M reductase subunit C-like uncharacterized protein (methanogenesis marker protein 7)